MFITNQQKYVREREKLIHFAEAYANQGAGKRPRSKAKRKTADPDLVKWCEKWNKLFHSKMNQLCIEVGITKQ